MNEEAKRFFLIAVLSDARAKQTSLESNNLTDFNKWNISKNLLTELQEATNSAFDDSNFTQIVLSRVKSAWANPELSIEEILNAV